MLTDGHLLLAAPAPHPGRAGRVSTLALAPAFRSMRGVALFTPTSSTATVTQADTVLARIARGLANGGGLRALAARSLAINRGSPEPASQKIRLCRRPSSH